jgi:hypothetical protein
MARVRSKFSAAWRALREQALHESLPNILIAITVAILFFFISRELALAVVILREVTLYFQKSYQLYRKYTVQVTPDLPSERAAEEPSPKKTLRSGSSLNLKYTVQVTPESPSERAAEEPSPKKTLHSGPSLKRIAVTASWVIFIAILVLLLLHVYFRIFGPTP